jgi:hypothetical protein
MIKSLAMRGKFGLSGVLFALPSLLFSAHGRAEDSRDPAAAEELFRQGRAAAQRKDFSTACAKFRESNRLDPAVGTVFNIADCEEKLDRLATSWTLFQEVEQRLPRDDDRRAIATERARSLEARVPTLSIHVVHSERTDFVVRRDGVVLGAASLDTPLPVDAGEHLVVVEAPGTESAQYTSHVVDGDHASLDVSVGSAVRVAQQPAVIAATETQPAGARPSHTAAYVAGGVGVAGVITGVAAGLIALTKKSTVDTQCPEKQCTKTGLDAVDAGKTFGVISTVGFIAGGLGLGAATYLFLSAPVAESSRSSAYLIGFRAKW